MRKKLLSGLFWVLLANIVIKPFWILGIELGVQRAVGTEMYGFYFVVMNLAYIFNILLDLGITNFNTRNIARNSLLIRKHLSGILTLKLMLLGLYAVVTFSVGLLLGYDSRQFALLAWLCLNQFLSSLILYLRSNFEGLLLFKLDSLLSVLDRVLMIIICGFLLWGPTRDVPFRIEWFVWAQTAAYLVTAAVALIALARRVGLKKLSWNVPFTLAVLKKSAPFALLVLLMASYNRLDPVLLQRLLPADGTLQAGIYAAAFRLLDALTMLAYLVSVPLLPIYAKLTKEAGKASSQSDGALRELSDITRIVFSFMFVVTVSIAVGCSLFSYDLMTLLYDEHVEETATVFRLLIFGFIPIGTTYIFGTLLTANGSLRQLNLFAALSLLLNIGVNLLCIPHWGAVGATVASLVAQSFIGIAQMILAGHLFRLRPSLGYLLRLFLFATGVTGVAWLLASCLPMMDLPWLRLVIAVAIVAVVALAAAFVLRLIDINELLSILQSDEAEETPAA